HHPDGHRRGQADAAAALARLLDRQVLVDEVYTGVAPAWNAATDAGTAPPRLTMPERGHEADSMDNVNIQCGNCGQFMAVASAQLGHQVRCPHCQQVVHVPAAAQPAPAQAPDSISFAPAEMSPGDRLEATRISVPPVSELESIFASPESGSDA